MLWTLIFISPLNKHNLAIISIHKETKQANSSQFSIVYNCFQCTEIY